MHDSRCIIFDVVLMCSFWINKSNWEEWENWLPFYRDQSKMSMVLAFLPVPNLIVLFVFLLLLPLLLVLLLIPPVLGPPLAKIWGALLGTLLLVLLATVGVPKSFSSMDIPVFCNPSWPLFTTDSFRDFPFSASIPTLVALWMACLVPSLTNSSAPLLSPCLIPLLSKTRPPPSQ